MSGNFTLKNCDARDFLRHEAARPNEDKASVLFSDPPYELKKGGRANPNGAGENILMGGKLSNKNYNNNGAICEIDLDWEDWAVLAYHALASQAEAIVMCNDKHVSRAQSAFEAAGFKFHNFLYWRKNDHGVSVVNRWMRKDTEYALYIYKGKARAVQARHSHLGQGFSTPDFKAECVITDSSTGQTYFHVNEKPVQLGLGWMGAIARPGETVIDPFMGTASFGVAALALGLAFRGCEKNRDIFQAASARLNSASDQGQSGLLQRYGGTIPLFAEAGL